MLWKASEWQTCSKWRSNQLQDLKHCFPAWHVNNGHSTRSKYEFYHRHNPWSIEGKEIPKRELLYEPNIRCRSSVQTLRLTSDDEMYIEVYSMYLGMSKHWHNSHEKTMQCAIYQSSHQWYPDGVWQPRSSNEKLQSIQRWTIGLLSRVAPWECAKLWFSHEHLPIVSWRHWLLQLKLDVCVWMCARVG